MQAKPSKMVSQYQPVRSAGDAFLKGLSTGLKNSYEKGK
jgi:hypothetical protein